MADFGALTDHFGILAISDGGAGTLADDLDLVASSQTPVADSRANALDENGDICASSWYGAGALYEASSTFSLSQNTLDTALLFLGEITGTPNKVITSIEVSTSNDGFPQITVSGTIGTETISAPATYTNVFTLPTYTLTGRKQAQEIGFSTGVGCKLTGSSFSASIELAQQEDGLGEPAAHGVSGGTIEVSADFVRVTAAPSWTPTDWTEQQAPTLDEGQAAYHTATATAGGTLTRDAV